jgi:hypothetical protein
MKDIIDIIDLMSDVADLSDAADLADIIDLSDTADLATSTDISDLVDAADSADPFIDSDDLPFVENTESLDASVDNTDCNEGGYNISFAGAPNDGTYITNGSTVSVNVDSGHPKGTFKVYLHDGKRYIDFDKTWICIQGKSRFAYGGNWYVLK